MKVTHVMVVGPCSACDGLQNGCDECSRTGFARFSITLEEFAKLFTPMTITDGRTYSRSILVPVPQGGEEP